jgi:hypothetical protein
VLRRPSSSTAGLAALILLALDCVTHPEDVPTRAPLATAPAAPAPTPSPPAPAGIVLRKGHTAIAEARDVALPFVIQPVPGARSALLVSQLAGERAAWARRVDEAGAGPLLRFVDERVVGAFDREGGATLVTSDGARLCFSSAARAGERTCFAGTPSAVVTVGERLALLELTTMRPPEPARGGRAATPKSAKPPPSKPKHGKGPAKGAGAKKKPAHAGPARKPSHPLVELFVRWAEPGGAVDAEARPTGLHFEAPLDGMTLADARARPPGVDLLWYETAPGRATRAPLGSGRLMAGSLRADGTLDFTSRVAVVDADLEYGQLKDHHAPRLVGGDLASVFLDVDARGQCEAIRVRPTLAHLTPPTSSCAVAPDRLAGVIEATEAGILERIFADEPRRAVGQPRSDFGLVAWAGDRGFYQRAGELRAVSRGDGATRTEPAPFGSRRARVAWGAFTPDGDGVAFAEGGVVHVDAAAAVQRAPAPGAVKLGALGAVEQPVDRRRAARIGATWWLARGERLRVWPDVDAAGAAGVQQGKPSMIEGAAIDASVLVGGPALGLSLEVSGGALRVSSLSPTGEIARLAALAVSPVRPGLDACERGAGGALVAGVSSADPTRVVAFTLDARGNAGPVRALPLSVRAGELAVRLTALPAGGAILTDLGRRRVVWLDDEARPLADAAWPEEESAAVCIDGRPSRLAVPSPTPGQLLRLPDLAEGSCVVGDPVWGRDGSLRWFGATSQGLDVQAESVALPLLPPVPVPAPAPAPAPLSPPLSSLPPPHCPPEMVLVASRFCVDRFEAVILDARTGEPLSPDYPTTPNLLDHALAEWATGRERAGNIHARAFPLPFISPARFGDKPEPVAVSRLGVRPNGYVTGLVAEAACAAAGKRLCSLDEFVTACRGEGDTLFPYGDTYEDGVCNVFREDHPAAILHGNASVGHLDPRLNRVVSRGRPMLERTGDSPACRSRWGSDAVYDMVGNLDEWVDEGNGAFAGGFYARSTRSGCEALVTAHPKAYLDYSTGVRCCRD